MKSLLSVYCDGASRKDGRGGWGYAVFEGAILLFTESGGEFETTNNRMELLAAIKALRSVKHRRASSIITIYSDSAYVVNGITDHVDMWLQTNWRTSANQPVKNKDLWQNLVDIDVVVKPEWKLVKGHAGIYGNELADELAGKGVPEVRK